MKTVKPRVGSLKQDKVRSVHGTKRITGNSLYALQKKFTRDNPRVCAECKRQGLVGFGDELDHIVPLHLGGHESDENRQWLCYRHHQEKSAAEAEKRSSGDGYGGVAEK